MTTKSPKWDELTKKERRIALAKDVIKHVRNERMAFITDNEAYCEINEDADADLADHVSTELQSRGPTEPVPQDLARDMMQTCSVCARGALLLSRIDRFNTITFGDLIDPRDGEFYVNQDRTTDLLEGSFSDFQLNLIEAAFECSFTMFPDRATLSDQKRQRLRSATGFGKRYRYADDRLVAIMENIIANGGKFKPWKAGTEDGR